MNVRTTIRAVGITAVATLALAACGSKDSDTTASDSGAGTTPPVVTPATTPATTSSTPITPATSSSTAGAPLSLTDISVQLSWIKNSEFAGEFEADSKGYYKDAGFSKVDLVSGPTTTENLVASGKATFGLSNAVSVAQAITQGAPIKIVGTTYQKNPFTILSIADKGNIMTPQDMIGKKIGVQASNETLFEALLAANGIDKSKVDIVPVQYDPAVLVDGKVDGFVAYLTNESIIVQSEGIKVTNLPFADNGLPFVAESVIASDDTISKHPDVVTAFLGAEIKGWKAACADPAGGAALAVTDYGKDLKLDQAKELLQAQIQCKDLVNTADTKTNGIFSISQSLIDENMKTLAGAKIPLTDPSKLFDLSLLPKS